MARRRSCCFIAGSTPPRTAMRYLRLSRDARAGGALLVAAVIAGVLVDYAVNRDAIWKHAAATTGGDPHRGEAMFIQYGCGSCHSAEGVRNASGLVGPQ